MQVIDLTQTLASDSSVYPGTRPPQLQAIRNLHQDGFREGALFLNTHHGTHLDAPAHFFEHGLTADRLSLDRLMGTALVVDCTGLEADQPIPVARLERNKTLADQADFLLFHTGWDRFWATDRYTQGHPYLSDALISYLLKQPKKGIGLDTISPDALQDQTFRAHRSLLQSPPCVIIENLTGLEQLGDQLVFFCALPLKMAGSDAAPVRAMAWLPDPS